MSSSPTPEQARALLAQASQAEATTRSGASWPQIAGLLGLGASSSLALPALAYVPSDLVALPVILMMLWVVASLVFMMVFGRSVKHGFGKRWVITIVTWGVLWGVGVFGTSTWFVGETWFLVASCALLSVVTLIGAWIEASQ